VGDTLTLEGTAYKVTRVSTARAVGGQYTKTKADGKFVVVNLTLTNKKDEPATILEDAVRLVGGNGKEYTVVRTPRSRSITRFFFSPTSSLTSRRRS
jgi:Domain of unknown function (DUF4352)